MRNTSLGCSGIRIGIRKPLTMTSIYLGTAVALLLTMVLGLAHVFRQPVRADTMLAVLLLGSTGVALVLILGHALAMPRVLDIALASALLAAVLGVAFVLRGWPDDDPMEDREP